MRTSSRTIRQQRQAKQEARKPWPDSVLRQIERESDADWPEGFDSWPIAGGRRERGGVMKRNPLSVTEQGVEWRPFLVEFETQEGTFGLEIYAVNAVHAIEVLDELKRTARILGEKFAVVDAKDVEDDE